MQRVEAMQRHADEALSNETVTTEDLKASPVRLTVRWRGRARATLLLDGEVGPDLLGAVLSV